MIAQIECCMINFKRPRSSFGVGKGMYEFHAGRACGFVLCRNEDKKATPMKVKSIYKAVYDFLQVSVQNTA